MEDRRGSSSRNAETGPLLGKKEEKGTTSVINRKEMTSPTISKDMEVLESDTTTRIIEEGETESPKEIGEVV